MVWKDIVGARPADFFAPGSLHLLEQFCAASVAQRANMERLAIDPTDYEAIDRLTKVGNLLNATAQKLRLSIQSALRTESGKNDEREAKVEAPRLLGAGVVRLDPKGRGKTGG